MPLQVLEIASGSRCGSTPGSRGEEVGGKVKARRPHVPTKSGLMVGLGETPGEILEVMRDLRAHDVDMLTIGQYLQPSRHHLPVARFAHPDEFRMFGEEAARMGFVNAACGPMVRSSYHADRQAKEAGAVG